MFVSSPQWHFAAQRHWTQPPDRREIQEIRFCLGSAVWISARTFGGYPKTSGSVRLCEFGKATQPGLREAFWRRALCLSHLFGSTGSLIEFEVLFQSESQLNAFSPDSSSICITATLSLEALLRLKLFLLCFPGLQLRP